MSLSNNPPPIKLTKSSRRDRLVEAVLDELLSWTPREFITAFRRWHHGAFSLTHLNVLTILEADVSVSMSDLAEGLDVSVASMTGIVDRMEQRGLVERGRNAADRRVVLVTPTEAGREVFREIDRGRREGLVKMLAQLGDRELAELLAGHRALRTARDAMIGLEGAQARATGDAPPGTTETPSRLHRRSTTAPKARDEKMLTEDPR